MTAMRAPGHAFDRMTGRARLATRERKANGNDEQGEANCHIRFRFGSKYRISSGSFCRPVMVNKG